MSDLLTISANAFPDELLYRNDTVLRADIFALWFRWFTEGLCNPLRYVRDETKTIVDVMADTFSRVNLIFSHEPEPQRMKLTEQLALHIMAEVTRQRQLGRTNATLAEKQELIDDSGDKPRCWICGFAFSKDAIDRFLKKRSGILLDPLEFVDILMPRGLSSRDISIEVEHKLPVASGGGGKDNLALACGWCNKSKGARTSIYDADARAPRCSYTLGPHTWHELPHPFWTVRLLATRGKCEFHSGCSADVTNAELFIAPSDHRGSPNPCNLHVFCAQHDPYATHRFYGREVVRRIWDDRARAST
jgi:hypothetical protein